MEMAYADTVKSPEIAGQNRVFAVPTIIVFMAGRESFRRSRNIGVSELAELIERHYQMMFDE
jgi:thioredoxin-like negative regulator of GroEL